MHIDNKNQDILILDEGTVQVLDDTTLKAEAKHLINFTQGNKSLHYNGSTSVLFVNATKNISLQSKRLWNKGISNPLYTNDILGIHRYLIKIKWYKIMFGLIKKRLWDY